MPNSSFIADDFGAIGKRLKEIERGTAARGIVWPDGVLVIVEGSQVSNDAVRAANVVFILHVNVDPARLMVAKTRDPDMTLKAITAVSTLLAQWYASIACSRGEILLSRSDAADLARRLGS